MPEQWQCGHCDLIVSLPDEVEAPDMYHTAVMFIREHRQIHWINRIGEAFMDGSDEALMALCEDGPEVSPGWKHPVTSDDVAPALAEADMIVRGV